MSKESIEIANKLNLSSVMNKTKWRELAIALDSNREFTPVIRAKYIFDALPMPGFSFFDWELLIQGESENIEWIEIDPIKREYMGQLVPDKETDFSKFIKNTLSQFNIPYSLENSFYKVWGYVNPDNQPNFISLPVLRGNTV